MTSTNFNVGMFEGRNSSRVLKPPGGGHSQIFGHADDEKPAPPKGRRPAPPDVSQLMQEKELKTEKNEAISQVSAGGDEAELKNNDSNKIADRIESKQSSQPKQRIPPGGFSSGFW